MTLSIHLTIHFLFALLVVWLVWSVWRQKILWILPPALFGGFFIDLDHLIDYFIAFGWRFDLGDFLAGRHFHVSNKIYIFFHAWEYVFLFLVLTFILKNKLFKSICLALVLGMFFHLMTDVFINHMTIESYSIIYRLDANFDSNIIAN